MIKKLYNKIKILFFNNHTYYVFRRYKQINDSHINGVLIEESFALHFIKPFKSKNIAQKEIDNAKLLEPWQEFIILCGC
jgi:hypothetical protein